MNGPTEDSANATFFFITGNRSIDRTEAAAAPQVTATLPLKFAYRSKKT